MKNGVIFDGFVRYLIKIGSDGNDSEWKYTEENCTQCIHFVPFCIIDATSIIRFVLKVKNLLSW